MYTHIHKPIEVPREQLIFKAAVGGIGWVGSASWPSAHTSIVYLTLQRGSGQWLLKTMQGADFFYSLVTSGKWAIVCLSAHEELRYWGGMHCLFTIGCIPVELLRWSHLQSKLTSWFDTWIRLQSQFFLSFLSGALFLWCSYYFCTDLNNRSVLSERSVVAEICKLRAEIPSGLLLELAFHLL